MATSAAAQRRTRGRRRSAPDRALEQPGVLLLAAIAAGVVLGLLSAINDEWPWWMQVFNLGAPWVLTAFGVGYFARTAHGGASLGLVTLLVAVAAYYTGGLLLGIREYASTAAQSTQVWGAVALVVGPTFGVAGHFVRRRQEWPRAIAGGVLAAALWGEAAWVAQHGLRWPWELVSVRLDGMAEWAAWGLIALGLAAVLAIPLTRRGNALALLAGLAGAVIVAFAAEAVSELIRGRGL
jgi:hypothetical protein